MFIAKAWITINLCFHIHTQLCYEVVKKKYSAWIHIGYRLSFCYPLCLWAVWFNNLIHNYQLPPRAICDIQAGCCCKVQAWSNQ